MKYLVMECGLSYAIVLDEQGRFLKVANLNYQVGQKVEHIIPLKKREKISIRKVATALAAAACICLISLLTFQFLLFPVGTVQLSINPCVAMRVNRLHYVVGLEGVNEDGKDLIEGVSYSWKRVEEVSDELADKAVQMGYLSQGGQIRLSVDSDNKDWKVAVEEMVVAELKVHLDQEIVIITGEDDTDPDPDSASSPLTSSPSPSSSSTEESSKAPVSSKGDDDSDDDDDHDDDRDTDDDDDKDHDHDNSDDRDDDDEEDDDGDDQDDNDEDKEEQDDDDEEKN